MVMRLSAFSSVGARPVLRRARVKVLNLVGTWVKMDRAGGGGTRMLSMPWIRPLVAPCCLVSLIFFIYAIWMGETYNISCGHSTVEVHLQPYQPGTDGHSLR